MKKYRIMGKTIDDKNKEVGFVILEENTMNVKVYSTDVVKEVLKKTKFVNVELDGKEIVGKECSINRLPKYDLMGNPLEKCLTILGITNIENINGHKEFRVIDENFNIRDIDDVTLSIFQKQGYKIVNGKVVPHMSGYFVSPIKGSFDIIGNDNNIKENKGIEKEYKDSYTINHIDFDYLFQVGLNLKTGKFIEHWTREDDIKIYNSYFQGVPTINNQEVLDFNRKKPLSWLEFEDFIKCLVLDGEYPGDNVEEINKNVNRYKKAIELKEFDMENARNNTCLSYISNVNSDILSFKAIKSESEYQEYIEELKLKYKEVVSFVSTSGKLKRIRLVTYKNKKVRETVICVMASKIYSTKMTPLLGKPDLFVNTLCLDNIDFSKVENFNKVLKNLFIDEHIEKISYNGKSYKISDVDSLGKLVRDIQLKIK